ncbi:uncharacterized protein [Acropora muricata]|uniref:uncharacterized protein n=1 Tax=Acropora muricata TaxID=159855 RepID=UPI0034E451F0
MRRLISTSYLSLTLEHDTMNNQISQHILVGSALRRPHATEYSPMDYQSMPDLGKIPRQPFRPHSACTVYTYAGTPYSARDQPSHLGKHTKTSLLRCKVATSTSSLYSTSSASPRHANKKRLCVIRDDYRFFKSGPVPKQTPPHGESLHGFLTGARYNRARYLDSRALVKLGVYIPKPGLNTFFVRDNTDDSATLGTPLDSPDESSSVAEEQTSDGKDSRLFSSRATNTDPHYLSIEHWHSSEWKTNRKPCKERRVQSAPVRIKAIKAYYHDYSTNTEIKAT